MFLRLTRIFLLTGATLLTPPALAATPDFRPDNNQPKLCIGEPEKAVFSDMLAWQQPVVDGLQAGRENTKAVFCLHSEGAIPGEEKGPSESYWKAPEPAGARYPDGNYIHGAPALAK